MHVEGSSSLLLLIREHSYLRAKPSEARLARSACLATLEEVALAHMDKFERDIVPRSGIALHRQRDPARPSRFSELNYSRTECVIEKKNYQR